MKKWPGFVPMYLSVRFGGGIIGKMGKGSLGFGMKELGGFCGDGAVDGKTGNKGTGNKGTGNKGIGNRK
jgi:hypothetical protein